MSTVTINGKTYRGNSVQVIGNKVIIDGVEATEHKDEKKINIHVDGNIEELSVDHAQKIMVHGDVKHLQTSSGDVDVDGNVGGGIQASSGDVEVSGDVGGSIQTSSGDVKCGTVGGDVRTMSGDIKYKKVKV